MLFSCVSQGAWHMPHDVLTVKDGKDQDFSTSYRQSKAGLQIFHKTSRTGLIYKTLTKLCCQYVNFQETNNKHNKIINICLKLIFTYFIQ